MKVANSRSSITRRQSALANVTQKRMSISISAPVNLKALVKIFLIDGSSKTLQMFENSTVLDALTQLKFNLDLQDISTFAIFCVEGQNCIRLELNQKLSEIKFDESNVKYLSTGISQDKKLLFRSWISIRCGIFERQVFQAGIKHPQSNAELWLAYMESVFMMMNKKYLLTEDESIMLGCLKLQAESGDFEPRIHSIDNLSRRVVDRFPSPVNDTMKGYLALSRVRKDFTKHEDLSERVRQVYARVAGKGKVEAQIEYLQSLQTWCPFYGATFFQVKCQYDETPLDPTQNPPPVMSIEAAVGPLAIFLITSTNPVIILRHQFSRIVKWQANIGDSSFTYWVLKPGLDVKDIEETREEKGEDHFNFNLYCDCVYLSIYSIEEFEHLVRSYVDYNNNDVFPCLPNAPDNLRMSSTASNSDSLTQDEIADENTTSSLLKRLGISTLLTSLYGESESSASASSTDSSLSSLPPPPPVLMGSGLPTCGPSDNDMPRDDTAMVSSSAFSKIYAPIAAVDNRRDAVGSDSDDKGSIVCDSGKPWELTEKEALALIPSKTKYVGGMEELQRLAEKADFSESDEDDDKEERLPRKQRVTSVGSGSSSSNAGGGTLRRASMAILRRFSMNPSKSTESADAEESGGESDDS